jgi:hypothetical protein
MFIRVKEQESPMILLTRMRRTRSKARNTTKHVKTIGTMNLSTWAQYDTRNFEDTTELALAVIPVEMGEVIISEEKSLVNCKEN